MKYEPISWTTDKWTRKCCKKTTPNKLIFYELTFSYACQSTARQWYLWNYLCLLGERQNKNTDATSVKRQDLGERQVTFVYMKTFLRFPSSNYVRKKNYSLTLQNKVTSIMSYYHNMGLEKYQQKDKDAWNYQFKFYRKEHWNLFATFGLNAKKYKLNY